MRLEGLRLVVDTNVLVAALLSPGRTPDRLLSLLLARGDTVLYDARIAEEYREVLGRPKFKKLDRAAIEALVNAMLACGEDLGAVPAWDGSMTDTDDRVFVEVALAGRADAIVTGNARHFPPDVGVRVLAPADLLRLLETTDPSAT